MRRRTKKLAALTVAAAGVVVAVGGFVAGPEEAGAAELGAPVSYEVGDTLVFASRHRNSSCSLTRSVVNNAPVAVRVVGTVTWDEHLTPLWPNQGSAAGDQGVILDPDEQATFVWTNTDYLPHVATGLTVRWSVMLNDGVAQIGANESELISPCRVVVEPPVGPSVPTVDTTVPTVPPPSSSSTTSPSSSTVPAPDTTSPPTVVSGPAPPPSFETQVLTSSIGPRSELPNTGTSKVERAVQLALVLLGVGVLARSLGRSIPQGDEELGFEERG